MFYGITQKHLLQNLEKIRERLCVYTGPPCDCKFGDEEDEPSMGRSERFSGCAEIHQAIAMLKNLTTREFELLSSGPRRKPLPFKTTGEHATGRTKKPRAKRVTFKCPNCGDKVAYRNAFCSTSCSLGH